jgi:hypothetical protein
MGLPTGNGTRADSRRDMPPRNWTRFGFARGKNESGTLPLIRALDSAVKGGDDLRGDNTATVLKELEAAINLCSAEFFKAAVPI